ncbi:MAG: Holliday junction branch migration protein RuvA [SAR324 cluster bacterium]|nr:Holliday junction branch migration protein RuvA [SAR324 cluster bacterium]
MIAWLKGLILEIDDNEIIIDSNGVGYRVTIGDNLKFQKNIFLNEEVEVAIYTAVKEDGIRLFGFDSFFTRKIFVILLGVNGIGPKVALKIVDQLGAKEILNAIGNSNPLVFTQVSGVGKKTAQRIILDLQGKIDVLQYKGQAHEDSGQTEINPASQGQVDILADVASALSNLGFSIKDTDNVIVKNLTPQSTLDELLRKCLMDLRQGL